MIVKAIRAKMAAVSTVTIPSSANATPAMKDSCAKTTSTSATQTRVKMAAFAETRKTAMNVSVLWELGATTAKATTTTASAIPVSTATALMESTSTNASAGQATLGKDARRKLMNASVIPA